MGTAQSASTPGHLKATGNRQSFHKLVIGNWNVTSLTGKEHEPLEEAKDIPCVGDISSTKLCRSTIVEPEEFAQAKVGILSSPQLASCVS